MDSTDFFFVFFNNIMISSSAELGKETFLALFWGLPLELGLSPKNWRFDGLIENIAVFGLRYFIWRLLV